MASNYWRFFGEIVGRQVKSQISRIKMHQKGMMMHQLLLEMEGNTRCFWSPFMHRELSSSLKLGSANPRNLCGLVCHKKETRNCCLPKATTIALCVVKGYDIWWLDSCCNLFICNGKRENVWFSSLVITFHSGCWQKKNMAQWSSSWPYNQRRIHQLKSFLCQCQSSLWKRISNPAVAAGKPVFCAPSQAFLVLVLF